MTILKIGTVAFKTHRVVVSKDLESDRIYCFKHTDSRCELESFDSEYMAADYIIEPLSNIVYYVKIDGDNPE